MENNNKKVVPPNPFVVWCRPVDEPLGKKDKKKSREGEGKLTAAGKTTLDPGGTRGDSGDSLAYVYEQIKDSELARFFFERRRKWFYRIDEGGMGEVIGSYMYHLAKRKKSSPPGASKRDIARGAYKDTMNFYIKKDNGPLLPTGPEIKSTLNESTINDMRTVIDEFTEFATVYLDINNAPSITYVPEMERKDTFACWSTDGITLAYKNRHPMDLFRSLAHELVHHKQHEMDVLHTESGQTGSEHENEANAIAGVIMRDFAKINPEYFSMESLSETKLPTARTRYSQPKKPSVRATKLGKSGHSRSGGLLKAVGKAILKAAKSTTKKSTKRKAAPLPKTVKRKNAPKPPPLPKQGKKETPASQLPAPEVPKVDKKTHELIDRKSKILQKIRTIRNRIPSDSTIQINGQLVNRRQYYDQLAMHHRTDIEKLGAENNLDIDTRRIQALPIRKAKPTGLGVPPPAPAGKPGMTVKTTNDAPKKKEPVKTKKKITPKYPPAVAGPPYLGKKKHLSEDSISLREKVGLISKSQRSGIDYQVIQEIYVRGLNEWDHSRLSREEYAFNRVNSFIAGGKARELDKDLLDDET